MTMEMLLEKEEYELPEFMVAIEMVILLNLIRNATKTKIIPVEVMTKFNLADKEYEAFFGIMPKCGHKNMLTISKNDALKTFITRNDMMWEYFEPELKRRLGELETNDTYSARVRNKLMKLIPGGEANIEQVAQKMGYSKRTLQRKLKEENTTFQKQLNCTRELLAKHYLKDHSLSSDEIAYLLGYEDLNSFVRAFHLWTGSTISEYKRNFGRC